MNTNIINNYSKLKFSLFILPLFLFIAIFVYLYSQDALSAEKYAQIQKNSFIFLNLKLSQFPILEYNLTQLGDALIILSLLSVFLVSAPKMWESLLTGSIVSGVFSNVLKRLFAVPRPAQAFGSDNIVIIGKTLSGFNSLPSGHSITIFTTLTILLFALMPRKLSYKLLWSFAILITGLVLIFTRVGVGAHHPLDVIVGSIVGYTSGLIGIFISREYKIWSWIGNKKYYPFFMVLFLVCAIIITSRIFTENLLVFYFPLLSLVVSLYTIIYVYVKK